MCSPREVVLVSQDPSSGGLHRLPGGEVWTVTVLAHRLLGGSSSSLSVSCLSVLPMLIAMAHAVSGACLGGALNPFSSHTPKRWSLAS